MATNLVLWGAQIAGFAAFLWFIVYKAGEASHHTFFIFCALSLLAQAAQVAESGLHGAAGTALSQSGYLAGTMLAIYRRFHLMRSSKDPTEKNSTH